MAVNRPGPRASKTAKWCTKRSFWADRRAVTESVGTAAFMVIMFTTGAALAGLIMSQSPEEPVNAELSFRIDVGAAGWASGDETLVVRHTGGDELLRDASRIDLHIDGALTTFEASALAGGFADGSLSVGETWTHTTSLPEGSDVRVEVFTKTRFAASSAPGGEGSNGFVEKSVFRAAAAATSSHCRLDAAAPFVKTWDRTPSDVDSATSGPIDVGLTFADDCAGVVGTPAPQLHYRLNDGSNPAWTTVGNMAFDGLARFTISIAEPGGGWIGHKGKDLEYYVDPPASDGNGNAGGATGVQVETIDDLTGQVPTASFTWNCNVLSCSFDATGSSDPDGTLVSWAWDLDDGNTDAGEQTNHDYAAAGTYDVRLTVTDDSGNTDDRVESVLVPGSNQPPTASFTYSCNGLTCDFDASGSSDTDGSVDAWSWDFGDSNSGSGETPSHTYGGDGTYTVTLTVTDDDLATDDHTDSATVNGGTPMHVHDIDHSRNGNKVIVKVKVRDDGENKLQDVDVTVTTCKSGGTCEEMTATTNGNGRAKMTWDGPGSGTYTTCVDAMTLADHWWDTDADHAPDEECATTSV